MLSYNLPCAVPLADICLCCLALGSGCRGSSLLTMLIFSRLFLYQNGDTVRMLHMPQCCSCIFILDYRCCPLSLSSRIYFRPSSLLDFASLATALHELICRLEQSQGWIGRNGSKREARCSLPFSQPERVPGSILSMCLSPIRELLPQWF